MKAIVTTAWHTYRSYHRNDKKMSTEDKVKLLEDIVSDICNKVAQITPRRALFHLMTRWCQKEPFHFQRDAVTMLSAITDQVQLSMDEFISKTKTWAIRTRTRNQEKGGVGCKTFSSDMPT